MIRGTTPIHKFKTDIDLSGAEEIYLTYRQRNHVLEKTKDACRFNEEGFEVRLSQAETLAFTSSGGAVEVQIRARYADGTAVASNILSVPVSDIIKDGEI